MKDGLVSKLEEKDDPGEYDAPTEIGVRDLGEIVSTIIQNRGDRNPSKQDLVAMVSGATGSTKQEVEGVIEGYISGKDREKKALAVHGGNDALAEMKPALSGYWSGAKLAIAEYVCDNNLRVGIGGELVTTASLILLSLGISAAAGIALGIGIVAGSLYARKSSFHDQLFEMKYRAIDARKDLDHEEKEFLQREAFAKWLCNMTGEEGTADKWETGVAFYNEMKEINVPLPEAAKYLKTVFSNAIEIQRVRCKLLVNDQKTIHRYSEESQIACSIFIRYIQDKKIPEGIAMHAIESQKRQFLKDPDACSHRSNLQDFFQPVKKPVFHALKMLEMTYGRDTREYTFF